MSAGQTSSGDYEFDIAFSFLSKDEGSATQLNELIRDRCRTWIYFEHQTSLQGADGVKAFSRVFGKQARLVVIFYRLEWGQQRATRHECNAISRRVDEEGDAFCYVVSLDKENPIPDFISPRKIWCDLGRFGFEVAAEALVKRLHDMNSTIPVMESIDQRAARLGRDREFMAKRERFIATSDSFAAAIEHAQIFANCISRQIAPIEAAIGRRFEISPNGSGCLVRSRIISMQAAWHNLRGPGTREAFFQIEIWQGSPPIPGTIVLPGFDPSQEPHVLSRMQFSIDLSRGTGVPIWKDKTMQEAQWTDQELAEKCLHAVMEQYEKIMRKC